MGKVSVIQWTDSTWSPWYGCTKVSEGCRECYAFRWAKRSGRNPNKVTRAKDGTFQAPIRWIEPLMVFVCSLGDFFHEDVRPIWRQHAWNIIRSANQHTYLLLTKRPENIKKYLPNDWPLDHVWLGVSVETQDYIHRISQLYDIPASKKFVSAEPLLGPLDFSEHMGFVDWIFTGGESGPNCRPCDLDWIRSIRDQCVEAGVSYFHKQHGGAKKIDGAWGGRELDGRTWDEIPERKTDG